MPGRRVSLAYGRTELTFPLPARAEILPIRSPRPALNQADFRAELLRLLPDPLPQGPISLVVADKTRLCGYPLILPWLLETLAERGADPGRITFFIAYGNHAAQSAAESLAAYGPVYTRFPFVHHVSTDLGLFVELGRTSRGTPVRIRRDLLASSLIITIGAISHHYFAGFGGGRKLLFPGLGEQQAIYCNHRLLLDPDRCELARGCRAGQLAGNPVAEDLAEIERLLPPYLSVHGLLDQTGTVTSVVCGRTPEDFFAACRRHDQVYRAGGTADFDLVLASAGGHPKDINLIQAHKAMDNAAAFVRDRGTLILLARCPDGIGSATFLPYFALGGYRAAFERLAADYCGNGGTALATMAKTARINICLVTDLAAEQCAAIGVTRITPEAACRLIARRQDRIAVIANSSLFIR